ncbi:hypothetical protein HanPI659440_Chr01g0027921 [Helianthus annuus]|nr:hypothetical protein HanPI659440_Chr01g0027921 [Helianthus annuus]
MKITTTFRDSCYLWAVRSVYYFSLTNLSTNRGAILIDPMCKISDMVRLKWLIPEILMFVAKCAPTIPIVPTADLVDKSVKLSEKRRIGGMNPGRYTGNRKLRTDMELLRVTDYLSRRLSEVDIPSIVSIEMRRRLRIQK